MPPPQPPVAVAVPVDDGRQLLWQLTVTFGGHVMTGVPLPVTVTVKEQVLVLLLASLKV